MNTLQAVPSAVENIDVPKPKPRARLQGVVNPEPQLCKDESTLVTKLTFDLYKSSMCDTLNYLVAMKAIRNSETKLIDSSTTDSIANLARIAQEKGIIPLKVVNTLESLDPRTPHQVRGRYLLSHAYDSISSRKHIVCWLEALSLIEGTASVLSQIHQENEFLANKIGSILSSVEKLQEFGYSLDVKNCRIIMNFSTTPDALEKVLLYWLKYIYNKNSYSGLLYPHINDLEWYLLHSSAFARMLADKVGKFCNAKLSETTRIKIIDQITEIELIEGDAGGAG